jgi:hypothetical protein
MRSSAHAAFPELAHCALSLFAGDTTNSFLNKNWREAFDTFKYLAQEAFGILFRDLSNRVYRRFSFKELFPE